MKTYKLQGHLLILQSTHTRTHTHTIKRTAIVCYNGTMGEFKAVHYFRDQMFCYATQGNSDKRRQVDATGSHVVNIDISLLCVCSYLFKRLRDNAQMI